MKMKLGVLVGVFSALSIAMAPLAISQTAGSTYVAETASVVGACGKLFDVDSNAAGLTAQERAAAIQKNLDYAIVHAKNRTPSAVRVLVVNRNPVVTVDGYHIATADGNSAARNNMSQMELAQKWADSIKFCLADAAAMDKYLSMLTGNYKQVVAVNNENVIAYLPAGKFVPVKLVTPIDSETSQAGDLVQAVISTDIPLRTSQSATTYEAYIPAGTIAEGRLSNAENSYTRKGAFSPRFEQFRLPDGSVIPIQGHIFGQVGSWTSWNTNPPVVESAAVAANTAIMASKGTICGSWRGNAIGAGLDVPYQKMVMVRRTGVVIPAGEGMMLQMAAPSAIALGGAPAAVASAPLLPLAMEPGSVEVKTVSEARVYAPVKRAYHAPKQVHHARVLPRKQEMILK